MTENLTLTHVTLKEHLEAVQKEREKALDLSREYQTYKDLTHNGLLKQLVEERLTYASRAEFDALKERIALSEGAGQGMRTLVTVISSVGALLVVLITVVAFVLPDAPPPVATINSERTVLQP